ncbi:hypothetical protein C0431_08215 [bacterium]|nr:hypothetical protein [bacterium]
MIGEISIRWAEPADYPLALRIWQKVYGADVFPEERMTPLAFHRFVIGFVGEVAGFAAIVCDYPTFWRGQVVPCAGIGAVATLPEFRGGGIGQQMMDGVVGLCREAGSEISSLYGFREPFYRKSGYEACGWRWQIRCPVDQLPKVGGDLVVREIDPADVRELDDCYRGFARRFNGSCERIEAHWSRRLGKKPPQIYAVGDPVEGYLWCNPHGFWNELEIGEMTWTSARGYENLLGLIRTLAINKGKVSWCEPPESSFARIYLDGLVEMSRHRPSMFAVLDPGALLERLEVDFGKFSFEFEGTTVGMGPRVEISKHQLIQALMGSPNLSEMVRWGEVKGDAGALAYLEMILSPMAVCCMEFF